MTARIEAGGVRLRPATTEDVAFLVELAARPEVAPFLAAVSSFHDPEELGSEVLRSEGDPRHHGRFVIEVAAERVGALAFDVANRRSRIAHVHAIMLHPDHRGRGVAEGAVRLLVRHLVVDLGYHRVELEVYGFNEAARRLVERVGFVREGVKRRAYRRHGDWVDGLLYGLLPDDLEP